MSKLLQNFENKVNVHPDTMSYGCKLVSMAQKLTDRGILTKEEVSKKVGHLLLDSSWGNPHDKRKCC